MSAKLKKTIKEKIQDIKDQRDVIVAFLNEFVSEAESKADELLATKDAGHFNNYYIEVMQHLDRCYNTFVLLSAEAEEKINGGSIAKGDDDSFSEGTEDTELGATAGANTTRDLRSSSTDSRHDSTKDNQNLSNSRASNFLCTTVDPCGDRDRDHCQSAKPDSFSVAATVVNVNTLDCENRNSDIKLRTNADSKCNIVQSSVLVCEDVNLNKQTNKPSAVKGVLSVLRPEQGDVDEENHKEESTEEKQSQEQQKMQVQENVVKKDQENTEIIHNINPEQESCILEQKVIKVEEIQSAEGKIKNLEKDHSKKSSKKEGIQLSQAILTEPSTQSLENNSLSLSEDCHSYVGFGNSCQPKLDIDVAKRFLRGVIQQANEDNMKLNNEKQERKKNAKGREKLQKSRNTSRDDADIVSETKHTDSKTGTQNNEEKHIQNEAVTCENEAVPFERKERGDKRETEVIDPKKETKELVVHSDCKEQASSKYVKDVLVENNLNQQDGKELSETNDEIVQDDQLLAKQDTKKSQVKKGAVTDSGDSVKCVEGKTGTDSNQQQSFCVVKDSVETSDLAETATEQSSSKNTDNLGGLIKNDDQTSNIAEKDDYGKGPGLRCEVLENSKIHSVIVSEANSPWMFYVQKFTTDLEEMMNDLRTVTDLEPIISPTEGMLCLAQFSKDGNFYRAKVVELRSKGKDISVEVLFLDYGNGESRKPSHLRKLPQKYASLPAQGILCALSQVAPNNKYGIWTEDQITLFTQIVSGRHFNCMPYHVSTKPDLPSIVGLFFNIPEQVIKDGNIVMQPGPKQISIHEYLIEKGLAKSVTVEEQLQLLYTLQHQKEPADQVDKNPTLAGQGDEKTQNIDRKGSIQSQSTVNLGSSMETLSDSLHSLPRLPKSTTREERERKALEEKDKREAKQREKDGRSTGVKHTKTESRGVKDSSKSKGVKTKSAKDSPRSKIRKCDDKVQTEDDTLTDSTRPVCSTPVKGHGIHNNLNIEKSLDTASEQGVENHNCVQNITEIKIKNVAEDVVSVWSSETESLHYTEDKSVNLPTNIDVDIPGLKVMLSHVESPSNFYVHLVSEVSAKTIDHMHISLNKTMEETSKKQLQKMSKSYKPSVGDLCCVLFSYDNQYYRGLVMGLELASPTKGSGSKEPSSENVGKVSVFYLDFGNHEVVPKRRVFPLPPQYADLPGLALHVCLAYIQPSVARGSPKKEVKWTDEATEKFISLTGFDSAMSMIIVDGNIQMMLEKHPNEVVKMDPLQVLLVDNTKEEEDVCVNMDLIRLGLARLCATENSSKEPPNSLQQTVTSPDQMKDWNPMMEDYMDARNSYKVDVDDAGVATVGYKGQDDQKICRFYQKNRCWSGDRCPYRHIIVPEGALTADVDYVYGDVMEEYYQDGLPDPGTWIACEVSAIINPAHFYIVLPFGKEPLASLEPAKKEGSASDGYGSFQQETLEDLMASLQDFYGGKQFEGSYVDYAPGEVVVARYSVDLQWYRARVISSGDRKVEVFYVDFGNKEFVSDISIRNIDPQFLHLPFQALECFLVDIEPVGGRDSFSQEARLQFRKLVDGKTLVAYIKSRSWSGCAWVELFDTTGEEDISIAGSLIERGLAQESTVLSSTTSGRGSNTSSLVSSQESLVLIPG